MGSSYYGNNDYYQDDFVFDQNDRNYNKNKFEKEHLISLFKNNSTVKNIADSKLIRQIKNHALEQIEDEHDQSPSNRYSYDFIFSNICRTRFKYLVTRFLVTFTIFISIVDYLLSTTFKFKTQSSYNKNNIFVVNFSKLIFKLILIYVSCLLISLMRKSNIHVSFKRKESIIKKTKLFLEYQIVYLMSFILLTYSTNTLNLLYSNFDNKLIGVIVVFSIITVYNLYSLYHNIDRLTFSQGSEFYQNPQLYIKTKSIKKIQTALKIGLYSIVALILTYVVTVKIGFHFFYEVLVDGVLMSILRLLSLKKSKKDEYLDKFFKENGLFENNYSPEDLNYLYSRRFENQNFHSSSGSSDTTFSKLKFLSGKQVFNILLINCLIFAIWEFVHLAFNAYLSLGPLHKGKLISLLSLRPIETLIDGLRSKNSFTRLTAFQELSMRSQLQVKGNLIENIYRNPIYNSKTNWSNILKECLKVIKNTNNKVYEYNLKINFKKDNEAYMNKIMELEKKKKLEELIRLQEREHLFGSNLSQMDDIDLVQLTNEYNKRKNNLWKNNDPSYLSNEDIHIQPEQTTENMDYLEGNFVFNYIYPKLKGFFNGKLSKFLFPDIKTPVTTLDPDLNISYDSRLNRIVRLIMNNLKKIIHRPEVDYVYSYYTNSVLEKDSQEICPLPSVYAESVFALCSLLTHSLDEVPKSYVVSSISHILKTYQISAVILGEYSELVKEEKGSKDLKTSIEILYDIVLAAFVEVIRKYRPLLKDIDLDDEVKDMIKFAME